MGMEHDVILRFGRDGLSIQTPKDASEDDENHMALATAIFLRLKKDPTFQDELAAWLVFERNGIKMESVPELPAISVELSIAIAKYPDWPMDVIHAAAIVAEEAGELVRAANRFVHGEGGTVQDMRIEAVQTAAMCIRFLRGLRGVK